MGYLSEADKKVIPPEKWEEMERLTANFWTGKPQGKKKPKQKKK